MCDADPICDHTGICTPQDPQTSLSNCIHCGREILIWDDCFNIIDRESDLQKFLGAEKYQPSLDAIYAGLGIPKDMLDPPGV